MHIATLSGSSNHWSDYQKLWPESMLMVSSDLATSEKYAVFSKPLTSSYKKMTLSLMRFKMTWTRNKKLVDRWEMQMIFSKWKSKSVRQRSIKSSNSLRERLRSPLRSTSAFLGWLYILSKRKKRQMATTKWHKQKSSMKLLSRSKSTKAKEPQCSELLKHRKKWQTASTTWLLKKMF